MEYDPVTFERECTAIQIPDGLTMVVSKGTEGIIMQVLGGNFTVRLATGYLVRVNGEHADAIGQEPIRPEDPTEAGGERTRGGQGGGACSAASGAQPWGRASPCRCRRRS